MSNTQGFGDRLAQAMEDYGPLCLGIDPHPSLLAQWDLADSPEGLAAFSERVVSVASGRVGVVKPQVALFERHGSAGFQVLEDLLSQLREQGTLVIADAKRGDIGSTMAAYSEAWLGKGSPLSTDSVTLSPYLGFESLRPALDQAQESHKGIFVLALTSNPEGKTVQHMGSDGSVAGQIISQAQEENTKNGFEKMGSCGLVIGATVGAALKDLRIDITEFNGPILAPGYGAQGATATSIAHTFSGVEKQILVNSSREILRHGPSDKALIDAIEFAKSDLKKINS